MGYLTNYGKLKDEKNESVLSDINIAWILDKKFMITFFFPALYKNLFRCTSNQWPIPFLFHNETKDVPNGAGFIEVQE